MKTLLALIIATAGFAAAAPTASAGGHRGHGHSNGHSHRGHVPILHVRKLYTKVVSRRCFTKSVHSHGRCVPVRYTTVTYRDVYSNGTSRTYSRTTRS